MKYFVRGLLSPAAPTTDGTPGKMGSMFYGPVIGWCWVMDIPFGSQHGVVTPIFSNTDPTRPDWFRIADDALEGMTELMLSCNIAVTVSGALGESSSFRLVLAVPGGLGGLS